MKKLNIDPEFSQLLPPLDEEEYRGLEENIKRDGCRDAIVVWAGQDIILDGHHRFQICRENKIEFDICEKDFANRDEAKLWILETQKRRNLIPYQKLELDEVKREILSLLALKKKQDAGKEYGKGHPKLPPTLAEPNPRDRETREQIAKSTGLGHSTVSKFNYIQKQADDETKNKLRSGETSIDNEIVSPILSLGGPLYLSKEQINGFYIVYKKHLNNSMQPL